MALLMVGMVKPARSLALGAVIKGLVCMSSWIRKGRAGAIAGGSDSLTIGLEQLHDALSGLDSLTGRSFHAFQEKFEPGFPRPFVRGLPGAGGNSPPDAS